MDGKQGLHVIPPRAGHDDDGLQDLLGICARTLMDRRPAEDSAGLIAQCRRLDELISALETRAIWARYGF